MPPPITAMRSGPLFIRLSRESGKPGDQVSGVAPCSSRGQALGPRFRGGDGYHLLSVVPQPLRGDCGAFGHGAQFLERDVGVELAVAGECAEAAITAGNDALAADNVGEAADALGDQLGM